MPARRLAVAGRCIPFDVSVGPGPGGKPVLASTRCAVESGDADRQFNSFFAPDPQSPMSGCRIYLASPAGGPERIVAGIGGRGVGLRDPVAWGGQIAWIEGPLSLSSTQRVLTRALAVGGRPAVVALEPRQSCYSESDATGVHRHCVAVTGSGSGCHGSDVFRVRVGATRGQRATDGLGTQVRGFAFAGGMEYALVDDSGCYTAGDCTLVALGRLHFR